MIYPPMWGPKSKSVAKLVYNYDGDYTRYDFIV